MNKLTKEQADEIAARASARDAALSSYAATDAQARRMKIGSRKDVLRSQYAIDADRIINCKFFNRCGDKTQVFSFRKNDDITRRAPHVQLVSRIARKIGGALRLNLDLIEAIAIGHDIGHTPFGHAGERILSELYFSHVKKLFNHNVHGVRVLNLINHNNLTIQTLDGILGHCGERVDGMYAPRALPSPDEFWHTFDDCYVDADAVGRLRPCTLEGCVVRLADMIAYIGKDRSDAAALGLTPEFSETCIGSSNKEIIENVAEDVIANSFDKPYLSLSDDVYAALETCKSENYKKIYGTADIGEPYDAVVKPMTEKLFERFLTDLERQDENSIIYRHYLRDGYIYDNYFVNNRINGYTVANSPIDITVDFIASMTDGYFIDAFGFLFPDDKLNSEVKYIGYFDGM